MAKKNAATLEQRQAIAQLAEELGREAFEATFNMVAKTVSAREMEATETATKAARRLSSSTAAKLIEALSPAPTAAAAETPVDVEIPFHCREAREYAKAVWNARWNPTTKTWTVSSAEAATDIAAVIDDEIETGGDPAPRYDITDADLERDAWLAAAREARFA